MQGLIEYRLAIDTTTEAGQQAVLDLAEKVIEVFVQTTVPSVAQKVPINSARVDHTGDLTVTVPGLFWDCPFDKSMKLAIMLGFLANPKGKLADEIRALTVRQLYETYVAPYSAVAESALNACNAPLLKALKNCVDTKSESNIAGILEVFLLDAGKEVAASPRPRKRRNLWMVDSPGAAATTLAPA